MKMLDVKKLKTKNLKAGLLSTDSNKPFKKSITRYYKARPSKKAFKKYYSNKKKIIRK